MADFYDLQSGVCIDIVVSCPAGKKCLLDRALTLRTRYVRALMDLEAVNRKYGERLRMAEFASQVVRRAAQNDEIREEVWENLRTSAKGGEATDYDSTWLKKDIERMKSAVESAKKGVETALEHLVRLLGNKTFHRHLLKHHQGPMRRADVKKYYDLDPPLQSDAKAPEYREMDHYLAVLTENLSATEKGLEFLDRLSDENYLRNHCPGFADLWSYIGKFTAASEPAGKFIHNWSPVIGSRIQRLIRTGKAATVRDILRDPDVKRHLDFLAKKLKIDVAEWLEKKAALYERGAARVARRMRYRAWSKSLVNAWLREGDRRFDAAYAKKLESIEHRAKLDSLWIGITLDGVAFALSAVKVATDLKNSKWNDYLGAANDLLGLTKTLAEGHQSRLLLREGDQFQAKAAQVARAAKVLGVVTCLVSAFLCAYEAYKGFRRKDWEVVAVNMAGVGLALGGAVAVVLEASVASGVLAVLGVVIAVLAMMILDAPIIDYIEDLEWGEKRNIKVGETIVEYYKQLGGPLKLDLVVDDYDANRSHLLLECKMLSDTQPVFVEVLEEKTGRRLGRRRVYPGLRKVRGRGGLEKAPGGWKFPWPMWNRRLKILRPWEIWDRIKRDDATKYVVRAGMDPSNDSRMKIEKMALNAVATGVRFPKAQSPFIQKALPSDWEHPLLDRYSEGGNYIAWPETGKLGVYVYTRYAEKCRIKVVASESGLFSSERMYDVTTPVTGGKTHANLRKTLVQILVKPPPADGEYTLLIEMSLLDPGGKELDSNRYTVKIARAEYIRGQLRS